MVYNSRPLDPSGSAVVRSAVVVGRCRISRFLNDLARPHVVGQDLAAGYAAMAADEARETDANAWSEALLGDVADEPRRDR